MLSGHPKLGSFEHFRSLAVRTRRTLGFYLKMLVRASLRVFWLARFTLRKLIASRRPVGKSPEHQLSELPVFYINLSSRKDRKELIEKELKRIGFGNPQRFEAVEASPGILGCGLSHLTLLSSLKHAKQPFLVCEDDLEFLANPGEISHLISEFLADPSLDVLCLANNPVTKPRVISKHLSIVNNSLTAACYLVKPRAIGPLVKVFGESVRLLEKGRPSHEAALDVLWRKVQQRTLIFSIPTKRIARQRASFSNIAGRWVDYGV